LDLAEFDCFIHQILHELSDFGRHLTAKILKSFAHMLDSIAQVTDVLHEINICKG
jgi:hypothetical protein